MKKKLGQKKEGELEFGAFCELYGKSIRNLVIEYLLENRGLDFAIGDMAKELNISRPKAYEVIKDFEKRGFVIKKRVVSGTQLYILNEKGWEVKQLVKNFKECIKRIIEEQTETPRDYVNVEASVGVACVRNV